MLAAELTLSLASVSEGDGCLAMTSSFDINSSRTLYSARTAEEWMPKKPVWMPVFVVIPASVTMHAAHPDHKGRVPKGPQLEGADFEQRIGTAIRMKDGSYAVRLTAVPVDGRLLIRPPRRGEYLDPMRKEN